MKPVDNVADLVAAIKANRLDGLPIVPIHPGTMETTVDEVERALLAAGRGLYQRRNEIVTAEQAKIEVRNGKIVDSMIIVQRGARALVEDLSACRMKRMQADGVWLTADKVPPRPIVVGARRSMPSAGFVEATPGPPPPAHYPVKRAALGKRQVPGGG